MLGAMFDVRRLTTTMVALPLMVACSRAVPSTVPPEEVLRRAAVASQSLTSARMTLSGEYAYRTAGADAPAVKGNVDLSGILQDGGRQAQLHVRLHADVRVSPGESFVLDGDGAVIVLEQDRAYLRVDALSSDPDTLFAPELLQDVLGTWWELPPARETGAVAEITPEPRLLRMQSDVVTVERDRGEVSYAGQQAHHYEVRVDPVKLRAFLEEEARQRGASLDQQVLEGLLAGLAASGELWIDARTYALLRARWIIADLPVNADGRLSLELDLAFTDHGNAPPVRPPEDARPFQPIPGVPLFPDGSAPDPALLPDVPPGMDDATLRRLLQQHSTTVVFPDDL